MTNRKLKKLHLFHPVLKLDALQTTGAEGRDYKLSEQPEVPQAEVPTREGTPELGRKRWAGFWRRFFARPHFSQASEPSPRPIYTSSQNLLLVRTLSQFNQNPLALVSDHPPYLIGLSDIWPPWPVFNKYPARAHKPLPLMFPLSNCHPLTPTLLPGYQFAPAHSVFRDGSEVGVSQ